MNVIRMQSTSVNMERLATICLEVTRATVLKDTQGTTARQVMSCNIKITQNGDLRDIYCIVVL